ncbi:MAG: hypothetical protein LKJ18_01965 [Ancrocorticia sp.]|nr:hypothetical protein [Ancrocorticia sp.]MCI1962905.1 hypothetical protein [Ancrocorticia sp.]MCI2001815.1 hypothetical protein [Ancrocorticia sp.]MCI2001868.1 hypothetical protein [Ancrocorticia sp.]
MLFAVADGCAVLSAGAAVAVLVGWAAPAGPIGVVVVEVEWLEWVDGFTAATAWWTLACVYAGSPLGS